MTSSLDFLVRRTEYCWRCQMCGGGGFFHRSAMRSVSIAKGWWMAIAQHKTIPNDGFHSQINYTRHSRLPHTKGAPRLRFLARLCIHPWMTRRVGGARLRGVNCVHREVYSHFQPISCRDFVAVRLRTALMVPVNPSQPRQYVRSSGRKTGDAAIGGKRCA